MGPQEVAFLRCVKVCWQASHWCAERQKPSWGGTGSFVRNPQRPGFTRRVLAKASETAEHFVGSEGSHQLLFTSRGFQVPDPEANHPICWESSWAAFLAIVLRHPKRSLASGAALETMAPAFAPQLHLFTLGPSEGNSFSSHSLNLCLRDGTLTGRCYFGHR